MADRKSYPADEVEIRRQIDKAVAGVQTKSLDILKQLYARDVVSFDVEPPLQYVGQAAKLENWSKVFDFFDVVNYEVRDLRFTVGDDLALGHGFVRLSGTRSDGTATDGMWVRVSYGMRKIDDVWLIAHDHVSVPLDVVSGNGVVDLTP
jgi:ketosteroid isomerase-like protein